MPVLELHAILKLVQCVLAALGVFAATCMQCLVKHFAMQLAGLLKLLSPTWKRLALAGPHFHTTLLQAAQVKHYAAPHVFDLAVVFISAHLG